MATVLTNVGEEWAASRLAGANGTVNSYNIAATHIGWGTGTAGAVKGDTALDAEVGSRSSAGISVVESGSDAKFKATATLTAGASYAITEAGLFSATTSGSMFVRGDFAEINLNSGDQITFTITIDPQ